MDYIEIYKALNLYLYIKFWGVEIKICFHLLATFQGEISYVFDPFYVCDVRYFLVRLGDSDYIQTYLIDLYLTSDAASFAYTASVPQVEWAPGIGHAPYQLFDHRICNKDLSLGNQNQWIGLYIPNSRIVCENDYATQRVNGYMQSLHMCVQQIMEVSISKLFHVCVDVVAGPWPLSCFLLQSFVLCYI